MKLWRCLHMALCLCLALLPAGCVMDDPGPCPGAASPVTLNLGVSLTRAAEPGTSVGDASTPTDMKVWIFDQDDRPVDYFQVDRPPFAGSDILGEMVNTTERRIDLPDAIRELRIHVVLNSGNATDLALGEASTVADIQQATFAGLQTGLQDNQVPIYGTGTVTVNQPRRERYAVSIDATRAVGKLELLFTKDSPSAYLEITGATLTHLPEQGWLVEKTDGSTPAIGQVSSVQLMGQSQTIDRSLPPATAGLGDFSNHESSFQSLTLVQSYLLENPYGGQWTALEGNADYTYPDQITERDKRYLLTVRYLTAPGGPEQTQLIYLPKVTRNEWNKIFARVRSGGYELQLEVQPWEVEEINVDFKDELSYVSDGWQPGSIIRRTGNTVQLDPAQPAVLRFTIQSPNSATWHANLGGADPRAFRIVPGYDSGAACEADPATGQLTPVEQEIRIEVTDPTSEDSHEAVLHVYADIGGVTYELDLTGDNTVEGNPDDEVNRFTLLQTY